MTDQFVRVGRSRLRVSVRDGSDGPPLLLINGLGGVLEMWGPLRESLTRPTIAFDAPGTGKSPAALVPLPVPVLARMIDRLVAALGHDRVDVLGVSLGGVLAQQLAVQHRRRVRRLVLVSTGFGYGSVPGSLGAWRHMVSPRRFVDRSHYVALLPALVGGRFRHDDDLAGRYADLRTAHRPDPRGYYGQMWGAATWSTLGLVPAIGQRTLIVSGDDDPLVSVWNSRLLARGIRRGELHVIRGGGHVLPFERPDELAALIDAFLG